MSKLLSPLTQLIIVIPSINISIGIWSTSRSILSWHSIDTWSAVSRWLAECWLTHMHQLKIRQLLTACQPRCWWSVNWGVNGESILYRLSVNQGCWSWVLIKDINQGYQSTLACRCPQYTWSVNSNIQNQMMGKYVIVERNSWSISRLFKIMFLGSNLCERILRFYFVPDCDCWARIKRKTCK